MLSVGYSLAALRATHCSHVPRAGALALERLVERKALEPALTKLAKTICVLARADVAALEREAEALRAKADAERRRGEELARERDLLTKLRTQAEGASHRQVCAVEASLAIARAVR